MNTTTKTEAEKRAAFEESFARNIKAGKLSDLIPYGQDAAHIAAIAGWVAQMDSSERAAIEEKAGVKADDAIWARVIDDVRARPVRYMAACAALFGEVR